MASECWIKVDSASTCSTRFGKLWSFPRTSCTWQCRSTGVVVRCCVISWTRHGGSISTISRALSSLYSIPILWLPNFPMLSIYIYYIYPYISIYSIYSIFTFFVFLCSAPSVSTFEFGHVFSMSPQIQERLRCGDPGTDGFHARSLQPAACLGDTVMAMARGPDGRVATWEVTAWSAKMEHGTSYFIQFYQQIIKGKFSDANASIYWFAHPFFSTQHFFKYDSRVLLTLRYSATAISDAFCQHLEPRICQELQGWTSYPVTCWR